MVDAPTLETPVADLVLGDPSRAGLLSDLGLDYGCGAARSLRDSCAQAGLDPALVLLLLTRQSTPPTQERGLSRRGLMAQLILRHHFYLQRRLPRLGSLAGHVAERHGASRPELVEIGRLLGLFGRHMDQERVREERVLFPLVQALDRPGSPSERPSLILTLELDLLREQQRLAAANLFQIQELTRGGPAPWPACHSVRAFYAQLAELTQETRLHLARGARLQEMVRAPGGGWGPG